MSQDQLNSIDGMMRKITSLQNDLIQLKGYFLKEGVQEAEVSTSVTEILQDVATDDFQKLKALLESDAWPHAVNPQLICNIQSEEDKFERAEGILDIMVNENLEGKKFLDFGCGEGHVAIKAKEKCELSIGYDIQKSGSNDWNDVLTTNFEKVKSHAPYSVVLLYDVIDHATNESPVEILEKIKLLTNKDSTIYMRCHPFIGRHGGHLYQTINKAFMHIVFNKKEMSDLGYETNDTQAVLKPLAQYKNFIDQSGLVMKNYTIDRYPVEPFFSKNKLVKNRIMSVFSDKGLFPEFQMQQSFVDYVLTNPS